ncbi:MAG: hypothetical protein K6F73_07400 [Lachnospiraceae bacterium]|nr:hypothetical protein [Lachnospiraceae bacterium]
MSNIDKLLLARNELENDIDKLQSSLTLSESDMMIVLEMILSTSRYKSIVRNIYNNIKPAKQEQDGESEQKEEECSNE